MVEYDVWPTLWTLLQAILDVCWTPASSDTVFVITAKSGFFSACGQELL